MKKGIVYLVGAGPGDCGLITVKGLQLLRNCEVVVYDRLASSRLLDEVPEGCEKINVGKRVGSHAVTQDEINEILVQKGLEGRRVVRLKGGDPFVFGRGGEEIMALRKEDIPYEVVPGVTSSIAAAAYAGIPVTHRGFSQSFHVITGYTITTESTVTDQFEKLAALEGTLVFLMGMGNLEKIVSGLMQYGKSPKTPAAIISEGTTPRQRSVRGTLGTICEIAQREKMSAPAVIVIGEVADLDLVYKGGHSLVGVKAGIAATSYFTDKLERLLESEGAKPVKLETGRLKIYEIDAELEQALEDLAEWKWLAFTSSNAVDVFFKLLEEKGVDYRKLAHIKFAVIGSGTKKNLKKYGFIADYMPEKYTALALGKGLRQIVAAGEKVLIPRAQKGSEELVQQLKEGGISYADIKTYDMVMDKTQLERDLQQTEVLDYLIFGSAGGVRSFIQEGGEKAARLMKEATLVALGEVTAATLKSFGYERVLTAEPFTAEGVVQKILEDRMGSNIEASKQ